MIDARQFVRSKLLEICANVKMSKPDGDVVLPLICYSQVSNLPPDPMLEGLYSRVGWRIAVYASSFAELRTLVERVDEMMTDNIGFTRTNITPDDQARVGTDLYLCRLSYSGLIHDLSHEVIRKSS